MRYYADAAQTDTWPITAPVGHLPVRPSLHCDTERPAIRRKELVAVVAAALVGLLLAFGWVIAHESGRSASRSCLLGAYIGRQPGGVIPRFPAFARFEALVRRRLDIDSHFVPWDFGAARAERADIRAGRIPMVSWTPDGVATADQIVRGTQDKLIARVARELGSVGGPVLLRFAYEMDRTPIGSPAATITAWRHVRELFKRVHADNVKFVWAVTARGIAARVSQSYFPGGRNVDWIAVDGYNRYPQSRWTTPVQLFAPFYRWASRYARPLMIAESGTPEDASNAGRKGIWLIALSRWLLSHPRVQAWVYTDSITNLGFDDRANTSPSSLESYRRAIASWCPKTNDRLRS